MMNEFCKGSGFFGGGLGVVLFDGAGEDFAFDEMDRIDGDAEFPLVDAQGG